MSILLRVAALLLSACTAVSVAAEDGRLEALGDRLAQMINDRDADAMAQRIDMEALGARVLEGMTLSEADQVGFLAGFNRSRSSLAQGTMTQAEARRGAARRVLSGSRAGGSRHVVRIAFSDAEGESLGYEYLEFELDRSGRIVDWISHAQGLRASDGMRRVAATMLQDPGLLGRVFGTTRIDEDARRSFEALRVAMQRADSAAAFRALEDLPESYRAQRDWATLRVGLAAELDDATYRGSLEHLAEHHGDAAELQFLLMDHYFLRGEHDRVIQSITSFERRVVEDGVTSMLKCSSARLSERVAEAVAFCKRSLELEPETESTWWLLIDVARGSGDAQLALDTLSGYEQQFDTEFDPDRLIALPEYAWLAGHASFEAWAQARR